MSRKERYYRFVTSSVLQRFFELEDGVVSAVFDPRLLNYRIDVNRIFNKLTKPEQELLASIHRDGLGPKDAARLAGIQVERPDNLIVRIEVALGKQFERGRLMDMEAYLA